MKHDLVTSLFFFCSILFLISCNQNLKNEKSVSFQSKRKVDSLEYYLKLVKLSNDRDNKLKAISNYINTANSLKLNSKYLEGLKLKANIYYDYGNLSKATEYSEIMLQNAIKNNDSVYMGKAYYKVGFFYKKQEKYIYAFEKLNQSFKIRRNLNDSLNAGKCLMVMANIHLALGDHNAGKTTATDGLKYLENSNNYKTIIGLYHGIAFAFDELRNHNEALIWIDKAISLTMNPKTKNLIKQRTTLNLKHTRANILAKKGDYQESTKILKELLTKNEVKNNPKFLSTTLSNLANIKFLQKPTNPDSEKMLLEALTIRKAQEDTNGLFHSNILLTKYYRQKDKDKASYHARQAYAIIQEQEDYEALLEVLTLLTELEPDSLVYHQRFKEASLQLMEVRKKTREIYAPTRFENENLLKENEQKNQRIQKVRNQNNIYLLGIAFLLLGIVFAIHFFRQRTKYLGQQNKIVQLQASYETETRIAKRLHDELGNDIFQAILQYQQDPHNPQIAQKLNTAYNKARDISRENSEFEVGSAYLEELTEMLKNYTQNDIRLILRGSQKINWDTVDKTIKIAVYRVLQELMTNMQKHSKASLVAIVFATEKQQTTIKYSDNGVGIDLDCVLSKNGLRNIERRIQNIGGTLTFESQPNKGFKAQMQLPA